MPQIQLRAIEPDDIEAIYRWENDPRIWQYSAAHQPFSRETLTRFIQEQSDNDIYISRQLRLMADSETDGAVGCVDLYDFDPYHRRAGIGIIVDRNHRGKGYGGAILATLEPFARIHLQLHQLYSIVSVANPASNKLFQKAGYHTAGRLANWLWNGDSWEDAFFYQKTLE